MRAQVATLERCFVAIIIVVTLAFQASAKAHILAGQGGHYHQSLAVVTISRGNQSASGQEPVRPHGLSAGKSGIAARAELYERWRSNRKINRQLAYEAGKEYLQKYPDDQEYGKYVRKFVEEYEQEMRKVNLTDAIKAKDYAKAFVLGKQILAVEPEELNIIIQLAWNGFAAATSGDTSLNDPTISYTQKAIQLIEAGQKPESWAPFTGKEDGLGWLNYGLGVLNLKNSPNAARDHLIKAAQFESSVKKEPTIYYYLAYTYEVAEYKKLAEDYQARFAGKPETPESKAALENLNQVVDRLIDLYARAVAFAGTESRQRTNQWMEKLRTFYKFRHHGSTDGLDALIANITSKPLL